VVGFQYSLGTNEYGEDTVDISVTVKNTGDTAAKTWWRYTTPPRSTMTAGTRLKKPL
jgi:hypothetical protein